jgi:hypothetical protein
MKQAETDHILYQKLVTEEGRNTGALENFQGAQKVSLGLLKQSSKASMQKDCDQARIAVPPDIAS